MKYYDCLFAMSKNNEGYLAKLTELLLKDGKKMSFSIIGKYNIKNVVVDDIEDFILFTINDIYKSYNSSKKNFTDYSKYVLYKRLTSKIVSMSVSSKTKTESLDEVLEDGTPLIEVMMDKDYEPIPDQVSFNELHLKMSSPKAEESEMEKKIHKVYSLAAAGYSGTEIMEKLNLTEGQYRYLVKLMHKLAKKN